MRACLIKWISEADDATVERLYKLVKGLLRK